MPGPGRIARDNVDDCFLENGVGLEGKGEEKISGGRAGNGAVEVSVMGRKKGENVWTQGGKSLVVGGKGEDKRDRGQGGR